MKLNLKPSPAATSRTKNRLREHGNEMTLVRWDSPACFNGEPAGLFLASDGWKGWLPSNELTTTETK